MLKEKDDHVLSLEDKRVVLLLQGGGALGAYQVGAYKALDKACQAAGKKIDWVGGISIGAINAAVIAGPMGGDACEELDRLWEEILSPGFPPYDYNAFWQNLPPFCHGGWLAPLEPKYWNWLWEACGPVGQLNFFTSRFFRPWLFQWLGPLATDQLANYCTRPLRDTLNRHVDWGAIHKAGGIRLSLGATRVTDGEVEFFNSFDSPRWGARQRITAEHVMASAALPPAFPPVTIGGEPYWDGGVSSNTPIEQLAEDLAREEGDTIVFLIDLWDRKGAVPRSMEEVMWRQKSIQYGSRKSAAVSVVNEHELKARLGLAPPTRLEVCQVMFERPLGELDPQFSFSDADFSRTTFGTMQQQGYEDMSGAIRQKEPVLGVGGNHAVLYRYGTHGKHVETDRKYAEARMREEEKAPTRRAA